MRSSMGRAALVLSFALLAGCATPGSERPQSKLLEKADVGIPAERAAVPAASRAWWTVLGDEQLARLIGSALRDSPDLAAAQARVRRAAQLEAIARGAARPDLSANAHASRERFSGSYIYPPPLGGGWITDTRATLDFDYDFDFWHRHEALISASALRTGAAQAQAEEARLVLSVAVASSYAALQADLETLAIAKQRERTGERLAAIEQERVRRGLAPQSLAEARVAALDGVREDAAGIEGRARLRQNELAALCGRPAEKWQDVAPSHLQLPEALSEPRSLPADFLGRRPDLQAGRYLVEASLQDAAAARAQFYPNVNLAAFFGLQSIGLDQLLQGRSRTFGAGPALHLPLFSQGTLRAELGAHYADYDLAVEAYNRSLLDAVREVADRGAELESAAKRIDAAARSLAALRSSAHASEVRRQRGLSGDTQLLESRAAVLDEERSLAALRSAQFQAAIGLVKAMGGAYGTEHKRDGDGRE